MGKKGLIELSVAKQSTRLPWDSSWGREGWLQCCTEQGYSGIPRDGRIFPPELVLQARCGKPGEETQVTTFFFFFSFFWQQWQGKNQCAHSLLFKSVLWPSILSNLLQEAPIPPHFLKKRKIPVKHSASCYMRSHSLHAHFARRSFGTYLCRADSNLFIPACLCLGYKSWLQIYGNTPHPFHSSMVLWRPLRLRGNWLLRKYGPD